MLEVSVLILIAIRGDARLIGSSLGLKIESGRELACWRVDIGVELGDTSR